MRSWIEVQSNSDFPLQNIPFGVFSISNSDPKVGTRIGDTVIDLSELEKAGYFNDIISGKGVFNHATLNPFIEEGKTTTSKIRSKLIELFEEGNDTLKSNNDILHPIDTVTMHMPVKVGNYTDFYSSREHATNVGIMFRGKENALMPNWLHIPVGYHGRASSIVVSGTNLHRPKGQQKPNDEEPPVYGPCKLMDFELEMAFVTYPGKPLGDSISTDEAEDYIFGLALFNDWSARDIQKWEYVPLGPFLGKNFGSSVSPWIVTLDALEPFRSPGPQQEPKVLPYLEYSGNKNYDINLQVDLAPEGAEPTTICKSNMKHLYWNMAQQLAHHTVNGCNIENGDMYASGTISGPTEDSFGSMLELSWKGTKTIKLNNGEERKFIQDNDTITMKGYAEKDGLRVGFGEVSGRILPAK